jgi:hypothetical protein
MRRQIDRHAIAPREIAVDFAFGAQAGFIDHTHIGHRVPVVVGELHVGLTAEPLLNIRVADIGYDETPLFIFAFRAAGCRNAALPRLRGSSQAEAYGSGWLGIRPAS